LLKIYFDVKEKILKFLLVLLGFGAAACEEEQMTAYGCPTVEFSLKAKVTDKANRPIEGIKVQAATYAYNGNEYEFDSGKESYSDSKGNAAFKATIYRFPSPPYSVKIWFEDVDGAENGGEFASKQVEIKVSESDKSSSGAWVTTYSFDIGNVVLDKNTETGE